MRRAAALAAALAAAAALCAGGGAADVPVGVDLGAGTVNGKVVLGKSLNEVVRLFGRPDAYLRTPNLSYVRYGPAKTFSLLVLFRAQGTKLVAQATAFQNPALVEVRTGRLLTLKPGAIQRKLLAAYARDYRLGVPYHCTGGGECSGQLDAVGGKLHVSFGLAGDRTFIDLWRR